MRTAPLAALFVSLVLGVGTAHAAHDDSTLAALRVTVADVTDVTVTVESAGYGKNGSSFSSVRPGTAAPSPATVSFSGAFTHTYESYESPGVDTIRSFGTNVYADSPYYDDYDITEAHALHADSPEIDHDSGMTASLWQSGTAVIGVLASANVSVTGTPPPPTGGGTRLDDGGDVCGLLGIEPAALLPLLAAWRRRKGAARRLRVRLARVALEPLEPLERDGESRGY